MTNKYYQGLLKALPFESEFLFIDEIMFLDKAGLTIRTRFRYRLTSSVVKSHFAGQYIAGSLLTEQVCQSALLLKGAILGRLSSNEIFLGKVTSDYLKPVRPDMDVFAEVKVLREESPFFIFKGLIFNGDEKSAIIQAAAYINEP